MKVAVKSQETMYDDSKNDPSLYPQIAKNKLFFNDSEWRKTLTLSCSKKGISVIKMNKKANLNRIKRYAKLRFLQCNYAF